MISKLVFLSLLSSADAADSSASKSGTYQKLNFKYPSANTCGDIRDSYKEAMCCGSPAKETNVQLIPSAPPLSAYGGTNPCANTKPATGYDNKECFIDGVVNALEQSGTKVDAGYAGDLEAENPPITTDYFTAGLCPVNVHWHLGSEHYSTDEFDEYGKGPSGHVYKAGRRLSSRHNFSEAAGRRLADEVRLGFRCHHYDASDERFTKEYDWQHCTDMVVGETYEVHWPHSSMGACNTPNQYQTPFYDGVFCHFPVGLKTGTHDSVGVQGQIFTIINDESYYYPDLLRGAIVDGDFWKGVTKYTGSTTGTSRSNVICSSYTPITWQVDRKCHLISASSFDKMCADMKAQRDDMTGDLYPHGARELVADALAADNHQPRL
jgi:hypothetical protein